MRVMIGWLVLLLLLVACTAGPEVGVPETAGPEAVVVPEMTATVGVSIPAGPATAPRTVVATVPQPQPTRAPRPTVTATVTPPATPTRCPPGEVRPGTFMSNLAGESRYLVYLPPCYGLDGHVYPALYLFGGNTHDETAWVNYGLVEVAEAAIQSGEIPPLVIVMVDGGWIANQTSGGPNSYEGHFLDYLLPHVEERYCVWAEAAGRAIGGISRGGYWSLEIAFRHPEMFASVGGHSAALIDSHAGPEVNPQFTALTNELGDLRIYLDIGEDDYLLPNTLRLHEDMAAEGIPHTWVLNEGAHEDAYWPLHLREYLLWYVEPWSLERGEYPAGECAEE